MGVRKGSTLASILLVLAVAMTLIFVVAQSSMMHLRFTTEWERRQHARNLAESAVNEALAQVLTADDFGKSRAAGQAIRVSGGAYPEGAYGFLSFNSGEAQAEGARWSTNNLGASGTAGGDQRTVPQSTVHLVGLGRVGDLVQSVEAIVYRPPFPKALASSGPINATSYLRVSGLKGKEAYPGTVDGIPREDEDRGSIATNNAGPKALFLGPHCDIAGNAAACGGVDLDPTVTVGGEVRSGGPADVVPGFRLTEMVAELQAVQGTTKVAGTHPGGVVDWYVGCDGPLTIQGDLELKDGVVWSTGEMRIQGTVRGQGVVLSLGGIKVDHGADFSSTNLVALAARGDVELVASDAARYFFQGLLYSEGNVFAHDITILGSLIANGGADKGQLNLDHVNAISTVPSILVMGAIPQPAMSEESEAKDQRGPWDGGPYVSVTPRIDAVTGEKTYTVHIKSTAPQPLYDRTWPDLTYGQAKQLGQDVHDDKYQAYFKHGHGTGDAIYRGTDQAKLARPSSKYILDFTFNNLMSPADKTRVLLWRNL